MSGRTHRIEILIEPDFVPVELASTTDVLRVANRLSFKQLFDWHFVSTSATGQIEGMGGLSAQAKVPDDEAPLDDALIVCGGASVKAEFASIVRRILRYKRAARPMILLSDAAAEWILRHRDGGSMATHWESLAWMNELHPDLQPSAQLYNHDAITTAAGMLGTADVMLRLVASVESAALATEVSHVLVMERIRDAETPQRATDAAIEWPFVPKLAHVMRLMEQHIEKPLTMAQMARQAGISARQIERYFGRYVGLSPMAYYRRMRVRRGHALLKQTSLSVMEIALICGFASQSNFTTRYRDEFGITPSGFRRSLS